MNFQGRQTLEIIGEDAGDSRNTVHRYIRLTNLIPALQEAVDDGRLAFNPAVEVSYLDEADQEIVQEIMDRDQISPSLSQAQKHSLVDRLFDRRTADHGPVVRHDPDRILAVLQPEPDAID